MRNKDEIDGAPARYWQALPDGCLQCDLCPRLCKLHDGQRGLCFVRGRAGNGLFLTTYGRSSGFCVDPLEKKPLNHFYPGEAVLSFGTAGCNLTCKFCQNWDISKSRAMDRLGAEASPQTIAHAARTLGCRAIAFTYNDPVIFLEYAVDVAAACRAQGIKTVAVSAGYINDVARADFFTAMDACNIDLKAFSEDFYKRLCSGALAEVQETLRYIYHETSCWLEITTLLIPGENDSVAEITALSAWILEALGPDVPVHFTAFHPDYRMQQTAATPPRSLLQAWRIAKQAGLHHVYTGNIHHPATQATHCAGCGARLIGRDWHQLTDWALDEQGRCRQCQSPLAGHFAPRPGKWGRRRQPINIADFHQSAQP